MAPSVLVPSAVLPHCASTSTLMSSKGAITIDMRRLLTGGGPGGSAEFAEDRVRDLSLRIQLIVSPMLVSPPGPAAPAVEEALLCAGTLALAMLVTEAAMAGGLGALVARLSGQLASSGHLPAADVLVYGADAYTQQLWERQSLQSSSLLPHGAERLHHIVQQVDAEFAPTMMTFLRRSRYVALRAPCEPVEAPHAAVLAHSERNAAALNLCDCVVACVERVAGLPDGTLEGSVGRKQLLTALASERGRSALRSFSSALVGPLAADGGYSDVAGPGGVCDMLCRQQGDLLACVRLPMAVLAAEATGACFSGAGQ